MSFLTCTPRIPSPLGISFVKYRYDVKHVQRVTRDKDYIKTHKLTYRLFTNKLRSMCNIFIIFHYWTYTIDLKVSEKYPLPHIVGDS